MSHTIVEIHLWNDETKVQGNNIFYHWFKKEPKEICSIVQKGQKTKQQSANGDYLECSIYNLWYFWL